MQNSSHSSSYFIFLFLLLNHKIVSWQEFPLLSMPFNSLSFIRCKHIDRGHSVMWGHQQKTWSLDPGKIFNCWFVTLLFVGFPFPLCPFLTDLSRSCKYPCSMRTFKTPQCHASGKLVSKLLKGAVPHRKPWDAVLNAVQNQEEWHVEHKQCLFALDERANAAVSSLVKYFSTHFFPSYESSINHCYDSLYTY